MCKVSWSGPTEGHVAGTLRSVGMAVVTCGVGYMAHVATADVPFVEFLLRLTKCSWRVE